MNEYDIVLGPEDYFDPIEAMAEMDRSDLSDLEEEEHAGCEV
jgi:hypothetical protein